MFLSRLNEISGGCEKIVPVSESFWSNLKFLRMIDLTADPNRGFSSGEREGVTVLLLPPA